jgi:hypothetical protein
LARRLTASAACRSARRSTAMAQLADRLSVDDYGSLPLDSVLGGRGSCRLAQSSQRLRQLAARL